MERFFVVSIVAALASIPLYLLVPSLHRLAWLAAGAALFMGITWLTAMVVRVIVTADEVRIQHGLFGPSIPIDDIVSVRADRHGFKRFLLGFGWGLGGKALDGSHIYSTLGVPRGLVIRYRTEKGIAEAFVSSDDPEALITAIDRASKRTRVALPDAPAAQAEVDRIEAEADALEATDPPSRLEAPMTY